MMPASPAVQASGEGPQRRQYNPAMFRNYPAAAAAAPALLFAHGAGAGHDHPWIKRVASGLAGRGVRVVTFDFPYKAEKRSVPDRGPVLEAAFQSVWNEVAAEGGARLFAGGKSMGGRIASQAAAAHSLSPSPAGLVFFGYPLHPPGKPAQRRDRHLPDVGAPMLFLSGTRDPFGSPEELRELADGLSGATLHLVDGGDHSLAAPKKVDPAGSSLDRAIDLAARWILATAR
jgi:predicted alpha/beta-hydrolase family hydrolase